MKQIYNATNIRYIFTVAFIFVSIVLLAEYEQTYISSYISCTVEMPLQMVI